MNIIYKNIKEFHQQDLKSLFLSVDWSSGRHPKKLARAIQNYSAVFSAWHNDKLVGLISSLDDGVMTAYIHYVLVNPNYQKNNIGKTLLQMAKDYYKEYLNIVLISYTEQTSFYNKCGFKENSKTVPMFISSLV